MASFEGVLSRDLASLFYSAKRVVDRARAGQVNDPSAGEFPFYCTATFGDTGQPEVAAQIRLDADLGQTGTKDRRGRVHPKPETIQDVYTLVSSPDARSISQFGHEPSLLVTRLDRDRIIFPAWVATRLPSDIAKERSGIGVAVVSTSPTRIRIPLNEYSHGVELVSALMGIFHKPVRRVWNFGSNRSPSPVDPGVEADLRAASYSFSGRVGGIVNSYPRIT